MTVTTESSGIVGAIRGPELAPGDRVGRFTVEQAVAIPRGATADFHAREDGTGNQVLLSFVPDLLLHAAAETIHEILSEAKAGSVVRNPGVLRVLAAGAHQDRPYIVTEPGPAISAADRMAASGEALPAKLATDIALQAARALAAVHGAGLTHRDVRPGNLLIDTDGNVRLAALGLVRSAEELQNLRLGIPLASPHYCSPEVYRGGEVDGRADLYSLGATYFHLITGRPPFEADTSLQVLHKHVAEDAPDPRSVRPELPAACATVIARSLTKSPKDRYSSADEMADDLRAALDALPHADAEPARIGPACSSAPVAKAAAPPAFDPPMRTDKSDKPSVRAQSQGRGEISTIRTTTVGMSSTAWVAAAALMITVALGAGAVVFMNYSGQASTESPEPVAKPPVKPDAPTGSEDITRMLQPSGPDAVSDEYQRIATAVDAAGKTPSRQELRAALRQARQFSDKHEKSARDDHRDYAEKALALSVRLWDDAQTSFDDPVNKWHCLTYSSDGSLLAAGGDDGFVRVWELSSNTQTRKVGGHKGAVGAVAISADGTFATAGHDKTLLIFPPGAAAPKHKFTVGKSRATSLAFTRDGKLLAASVGEAGLRLWETEGKDRGLTKGGAGPMSFVTFSRDSRTVLGGVAKDKSVAMFNVETGMAAGKIPNWSQPVVALGFAAPGQPLMVSSKGKIRTWDLAVGKEKEKSAWGGSAKLNVTAAAVSADGSRVVLAWDNNTLELLDNREHAAIAKFKGHRARVTAAAFAPDGKTFATCSLDGSVKIWSTIAPPASDASP